MAAQQSTASPAETNQREAGPTPPSERILSLDVLRGFAVLGILVINIWLFALPTAGWLNPTLYGDFSGANYAAWLVSHVFFEQTFVTLFTILFGAGMVLFLESKERNGQPGRRLHFKRIFWLLAIGVAHGYLLWIGDVLVFYALCGFILVFVRNWQPRRLLVLGLLMFALPALLYGFGGLGYAMADAETQTEIEQGLVAGFGAEGSVEDEVAIYQGSWLEQVEYRAPILLSMQTIGFIFEAFWLYGGLMVVGMALYKWGLLSNERRTRWYRRLLLLGAGTGLPLILAGVWFKESVGWDTGHVLLLGRLFNYWGSLLLALAYLAGIMLLCRGAPQWRVTTALAAVGRTAFSNYLLQTVVVTTLFYGYGVGLFGEVSRLGLLAVVVGVWAIQIPLSVAWLRRYQYGPVEWVWRTLTYGDCQPMRRSS